MSDNLELAQKAIDEVASSELAFAKFLSPNDTGLTGAHQCGIYIPKNSVPLIFPQLFDRGENHERFVTIQWNGEPAITTESRFIYYGSRTRDEYRITQFGRGFNLLKPDHTGDLLIICKQSEDKYSAYTLSDDEAIQSFLDAFSISPTEVNRLIKDGVTADSSNDIFDTYYIEFGKDFPRTDVMAVSAEEIDSILNGEPIDISADNLLIRWIDTEYKLFRHIEERHYAFVTLELAESLDSFIKVGLEITNRRKARAGKSLEHHLSAIFDSRDIKYTPQAKTEGNKKPDFIFPSEDSYRNESFPADKLTFLGAKTTCKDRWRQVLNEANRITPKYLFTLQQGVSPNQLDEMHEENLILVVPKAYHSYYPKTEYKSVISLEEFITLVSTKQEEK